LRGLYISRPRSFTRFPQGEPSVVESSVRPSPMPSEPVGDTVALPGTQGRRWTTPPVGSPVRLRFDLQRRAHDNLRRHVVRGAQRFVVLALADLVSFGIMRELIQMVRDVRIAGTWAADLAQTIIPQGILNGWQYASALFVSLALLGCYRQGDRRRDPQRLFLAAALATALPLWMSIWIRGPSVVLVEYAVTTVLVWGGVLVERLVVDRIVGRVRPPEESAARTLFVGSASECAAVLEMPAFRSTTEFRRVGIVDVELPIASDSLGHLVEIGRLIHESRADTVVVCSNLGEGQLNDLLGVALATGCRVLKLPRGIGVPGVQPEIVWRRGQPLLELTAPSLRGWQLALKRVIDVVGALIGLVLFSPLFAWIALRIKLDSPGPVLFRQVRVGQEGRRFKILKFRTMAVDAEERREALKTRSLYSDARLFKVRDDPRITRVGRWLRGMSLDELPQFVNVLKGEMSLVGPRPPLPCEVEFYEAHHYARFDVRPGITGPWQVNGRNEIVDFDKVVALESEYIRHWSLWRDVVLLARTIPAVTRRRGAM
jgi:exopolysaccharide biosynthesis polyprenyl glycosylphosphotransferase